MPRRGESPKAIALQVDLARKLSTATCSGIHRLVARNASASAAKPSGVVMGVLHAVGVHR